jgi:hypothetical protein
VDSVAGDEGLVTLKIGPRILRRHLIFDELALRAAT